MSIRTKTPAIGDMLRGRRAAYRPKGRQLGGLSSLVEPFHPNWLLADQAGQIIKMFHGGHALGSTN